MDLLKTSWFIFFLICVVDFLSGQSDVFIRPVSFSQYYNNYELINPAMVGTDAHYKMSLGNKKLLGNFSKISTYYLSAYAKLTNKYVSKNSPFSALGVYVYNDQEGKYLNRSRFYLSYAWHGKVSKNFNFSGGFRLGGMNYSVEGTDLSGNGSDIVPDGIVGLQLYNQYFHIGVAYNQIFNSKVQPLVEVGILSPYYSCTASANMIFSDKLHLETHTFIQIPSITAPTLVDFTLEVDWGRTVGLAIGIHKSRMIINSFELNNLFKEDKGLNISITYGYPLPSVGAGNNFIEFGLAYLLDI